MKVSPFELHGRERHARRVNRLAVRPRVGLLGRALGTTGGIRQREDDRPLVDPAHGLDHFPTEGPPTVLTPMMVVGLMLSIAATKSRVGACWCAYGNWKSTRSVRVDSSRPLTSNMKTRDCASLMPHTLFAQGGAEQIRQADAGGSGAKKKIPLVFELRAFELRGIDHACQRDARGALHVVVVDAVFVAVALEKMDPCP